MGTVDHAQKIMAEGAREVERGSREHAKREAQQMEPLPIQKSGPPSPKGQMRPGHE
jgi:hypothetical protein